MVQALVSGFILFVELREADRREKTFSFLLLKLVCVSDIFFKPAHQAYGKLYRTHSIT